MKKIVIAGVLGFGIIVGAMNMTSFANERNLKVEDMNLNNVSKESIFNVLSENAPNQVVDKNQINSRGASCCTINN